MLLLILINNIQTLYKPHFTCFRFNCCFGFFCLSIEMIDHGNNFNVYGTNPMFVPSYQNRLTGLPVSRKRSRDSCPFDDPSDLSFPNNNNNNGIFTFLDQDISMQIYQQLEIDRFISQHMEKMRSDIESIQRTNSPRLIAIAEEGLKRLRSKDDEITNIRRLNYALSEKVKSLTLDNQIWQQQAQSNEATATVLRHNLQQILAQTVDDVESCCGSNNNVEQRRMLANGGNDGEAYGRNGGDNSGRRWCRNCGKGELCVLLLPCRHLCVCTMCESSINVCPICKSTKNASVHVNMNAF
ncbi:putative BOI-related E3 ubiquitin-protein ligase 3 [Bidens hawaiensis]|uniref:putative BOI-related E3 ubiquitin-protein ligase 3 n=1 Tax=Bidens hawaiensis TaxID=980011 RepID=UPI00404B4C90